MAAESIGTETTRKVLISWKTLSLAHCTDTKASARWQIPRGIPARPHAFGEHNLPSVRAGLALSGEADLRVESLVRESVSFLLALRGAFR